MSHYPVLVIGPDPEGQLAPYDESIEVDAYRVEWEPEATLDAARGYINAPGNTDRPGFALEDEAALLDWWLGGEVTAGLIRREEGRWVRYSTANPNGHWDWYAFGGRFAGHLRLVPGAVGIDGASERSSWARWADVDVAAMRADAEAGAVAEWTIHEEVVARYGALPAVPGAEDPVAIDNYSGHPAVRACLERLDLFGVTPTDHFAGGDREAFLDRARARAVPGYALVAEGVWLQPAPMGWFGVSAASAAQEVAYLERANAVLDGLDGRAEVSVWDCHT